MMFCTDDKHPDSLVEGHINQLCARAVAKGIDLFKILQAACVNPVHHYKMKVGLLKEGHAADFIVVKDLRQFEVLQTYIDGEIVAENGKSKIRTQKSKLINNFSTDKKDVSDFAISASSRVAVPVIEALDGQLVPRLGPRHCCGGRGRYRLAVRLALHPRLGDIIAELLHHRGPARHRRENLRPRLEALELHHQPALWIAWARIGGARAQAEAVERGRN